MDAPLRVATSPDATMTLELYEADDFYLGFRDQAWHTHGDLLVPEYGATPREAAIAFFESVLADRQPICVSRNSGRDIELWITDDPQQEFRQIVAGEELQIRYWSGARPTA